MNTTLHRTLVACALLATNHITPLRAEETAADLAQELETAKTKLAIAQTKLELAKQQAELEKINGSAKIGPENAQPASLRLYKATDSPIERSRLKSILVEDYKTRHANKSITLHAMLAAENTPSPPANNDSASDSQFWSDLADSGFGITGGYGYFFSSRRTAQTVQVNYNFYRSWTKATKELGTAEAAKQADADTNSDLNQIKPWGGSHFTSFSGWLGTTSARLSNRDGTAKEMPIMVGISAGLGHISGRASAVNIDIGGALFNNRRFKTIEPYAGISVDLEVLQKLLSKITPSEPPAATK